MLFWDLNFRVCCSTFGVQVYPERLFPIEQIILFGVWQGARDFSPRRPNQFLYKNNSTIRRSYGIFQMDPDIAELDWYFAPILKL